MSAENKTVLLRRLLLARSGIWLIATLLGLAATLAAVGLLMVSGWFIAASALAGLIALGSQSFNYLMPSALIRMLAIVRTAARYGELVLSHQSVFGLLKDLRVNLFGQLAAQPVRVSSDFDSARQMHRLVSDIDTLDEFPLRVVAPWFQTACLTILLAAIICIQLPKYGLQIALLLLAVLWVPLGALALGNYLAARQNELTEQRRRALLFPLRMLTRLVLWQRWTEAQQPCLTLNDELAEIELKMCNISNILSVAVQYIFVAVFVALLCAGRQALQLKQIDVPQLLALLLGAFGLQEYVLPLCSNFSAFGVSRAAQQHLNSLLTTENMIENGQAICALPRGRLKICVENLSARMPDALVGPNDLNLEIESGQPCWISGASGIGKSTLLNVLAQELLPLKGRVLLNGEDSRYYDWRGKIGYLSQRSDIFAQTLAQNLRLGKPDAAENELRVVLDKVALTDWFESLPRGLDTPLGEYGAAVSGGQARRIALARLLLAPKQLLLLDEPFAGLDAKSRGIVWRSVREHQQNDLLVVVSHQIWDEVEQSGVQQIKLAETVI